VDKAYNMLAPNNIFGFESYMKAVKKELGLGKGSRVHRDG
jgi:hypothetical protein